MVEKVFIVDLRESSQRHLEEAREGEKGRCVEADGVCVWEGLLIRSKWWSHLLWTASLGRVFPH